MNHNEYPRHDQHVLVTGGAGFIGSNLAQRLVDDDRVARVTVLDDLSTGRRDNLDGIATNSDTTVDLIEGTVLDEALVTQLAAEATAVVHLAAIPSVPRSVEGGRVPAASARCPAMMVGSLTHRTDCWRFPSWPTRA